MTASSSPKMERLMILMAQKEASDLYLSTSAPIMIRLNGNMVPVNGEQKLTAEYIYELLNSILSTEQMQTLEETGELNIGIARASIGNFRFSCFKQRGSLAAVIRYIPLEVPAFNTLHLPSALAEMIMAKRGLILFVGATGSGKSTSIASLLDLRNEQVAGHILTVEDPIEFFFTNKRSVINQREIGVDTQSLHIGLKNALRQMPDCIFIGEIRDAQTMSSALAYAESGQLCVSTLHANNSYEALNRIMSFYPESIRPILLNDMASALKAIVSLRLIQTNEGKLRPAVEILQNTRLISDLIHKGDLFSIRDAMERSLADGCQTFEEDLARMVHDGLITKETAANFSDSASNLLWRLQNNPQEAFKNVRDQARGLDPSQDGPVFSEINLNFQPEETHD